MRHEGQITPFQRKYRRCMKCDSAAGTTLKDVSITRAPDTLIFHFGPAVPNELDKPDFVSILTLDLEDFVLPPMTLDDEAFITRNDPNRELSLFQIKSDRAVNPPFKYKAISIIWKVNRRSVKKGYPHYAATVKDPSTGCWRRFDDEEVTDFRFEDWESKCGKPHIIFYEREDLNIGMAF
ncbi:hypothetical protein GQ44DRAFT_697016 [Phaeosphaeriaceae sp. PMI808]|nr:hypothetical protein GQ44DRAFT_697016 [Phaeosphaeriaceae sp. PMI808]